MTRGRITGAVLAQILAQVLTGWTLVAHVAGWPDVSGLVVTSLLAAALVPFRHDGSLRDRAAGNFGAGILLAGFFWWEILNNGLDWMLSGSGFKLGIPGMMMLCATVLFCLAGALFWTVRDIGDAE